MVHVWTFARRQGMKLVAYMVFLKEKLSKSILTFSTGIFCLKGRLTYKMEIGMV